MAAPCPKYESAEWKELIRKLGEDNLPPIQQVKSMKMFMENNESEAQALNKLDPARYSPREKEEKLKALSDKVVFIGTPDPITEKKRHEYQDRSGEVLTSVSRKLDEIPAMAYRGDDTGSMYADSGTAVHGVFEQYAAGISLENIRKYAQENNVPESVVQYAAAFIDNLRQTGTILSEVNLRDPNLPIAGRADIIHLKNDGTVDIYDIKTAYRTPSKIIGNKKIWNPLEDYEGYKSQRYTTQLEFYGQMVEKAIGHPVSGHFIIPIEVEFKDNVFSNGIAKLNTLSIEDTKVYGYQSGARKWVDKALGVKRDAPLPGLLTADDSTDLIESLTGKIQNLGANLDKRAEELLRPERLKTVRGFKAYWNGRQWVTLNNQNDRAAQKTQIINEYLGRKEQNYRDIEPSVKNYIQTGKDTFLDSKGPEFVEFKSVLDDYRNDADVRSLSDIQGFEDKRSWLLIKKGQTTDLLYVGNEELDRPFMVSRDGNLLGKLFGSDRSLFGNAGFSWSDAKYELGSTLRNTVADAKKLEAAMIAVKLKSADPNITFDRVLIHSLGTNSPIPRAAVLTDLLPVLSKLIKHKKADSIVPASYKALPESMFVPSIYKQDFLKTFQDSVGDNLSYKDKQLVAGINSFYKDGRGLDDILGTIRDRLRTMEELGEASPENLDQRRALAELDFQLRNVETSMQPMSKYFEKWASMPQNIGNSIIQDVVLELKNAVARVRNLFWEGYKKDFNKTTENLFSSSGNLLSRIADRTISDTTKYYEPLFERDTYKIFQLVDGKQKEVNIELNSFSLIPEGSDAFNKLSEAQQNYITKFNDTIEKAAKMMGISWERGRIPLAAATFYNKFYRSVHGEQAAYQGLLAKAFANMEENFNGSSEVDDSKVRTLQNRFRSQANGPFEDNRRQELLGISEDGHINLDSHAQWETNLEVVADMFMMEAVRVQQFEKVSGLFSAANAIFEWQRSKLFEDKMGINLDWLRIWKDAQVHMKDQDSNTTIGRAVNTINKAASISLVTKPTVGVINYFSQQLSTFAQATANSLGVTQNYGLPQWMSAARIQINPQNAEKIDLLLQQLGLFDLSMTDLTNGRRREGNKSIFRLKYLYMMLSAGDWMSRGQVMIAQMTKDGTWDAYSVKDGKLEYDESKDDRFNGNKLDPAKGRALKDFTQRELTEQGVSPRTDGKLAQAYGTSQGNYIKNLADSVIGGFDRDSRANFNFFAFGKLIGLFKNWLPARLNALFDKQFVSKMNGSIQFEQKPDGEYSAVWTGKQMEGILQTVLYMAWYGQKYRQNPYQKLTPHQQNNIRTLAAHTIVLTTAVTMILSLGDDDDDKDPWKKTAANTLQRSLGDIIATYNILALKDFLYTPIAVVYIDRTLSQVWNVMSGEKDINKKTLNSLVNKVPLVNIFNDIYTTVDGESTISPTKPR